LIQAGFQVITDSYPSRQTIRFVYQEDLWLHINTFTNDWNLYYHSLNYCSMYLIWRRIGNILVWVHCVKRFNCIVIYLSDYFKVLQLVFSVCEVTVKCRPVLHHYVITYFWSSGIMGCILFTLVEGSPHSIIQ